MPSVLLWAYLAENLFLFAAQKNLRIFLSCFFTGRGRGGKRHLLLSACGRRAATSDWRNPKKRLRDLHAEQAGISSFLGWSLLLWDYQGRVALSLQRRRPRPVAEIGRSCWGSGLQNASAVQGTKQTQGAATRRLPRFESSGDLAVLNTQHLLRKPVCALKAPLGLSFPTGTAVLSGSLLARKREHTRRRTTS